MYTVPDVRGMDKATAESTLTAKQYDVKFVEVPAANYSLVGKVLKQEPVGVIGPYIERERTIVVTLSVGDKGSFVPDTLLKTEAEAVNMIKKAGYVPKVEYYVNQTQGMAGKVWTTDPLPYRNHPQGGTVVLQVAKPGQAMENFIGKHSAGVPPWVAEINRIKSLGLKSTVLLDKTTYVPQEDQKVYAQTPAPGAVLVAGSEIKVSAYKYAPPPPPPPKPTPMAIMPNVIGKTEQEATALITKAGMKVSVNYIAATAQNQGRVTAQSVPAGSRTAGPIVLTAAPLLPPPPPPPPAKPTPMTIMPGLVGQTEQDAKAFLTKAGLQVSVKYASAPKEKEGRVTGQSVPANTRTAGPVVLTVGSK
jgi:beta-lactam-binding protein with PASTA domain